MEEEDAPADGLPRQRPPTELQTVHDRLKLTKPNSSQRIRKGYDSPLLSWKFCQSGNRMIQGFKNGALRVQMLAKPFDLTQLGDFWIMAYQDNDRGSVNGVQLTHDDRLVQFDLFLNQKVSMRDMNESIREPSP